LAYALRPGLCSGVVTNGKISRELLTEGLGAFDEVEELGTGTFGTTFRVARSDDVYAIKVIHLEGLPAHLWEREVAALRTVDHPNVVAFRASGVFEVDDREYKFLECEYIDGRSVKDNLEAGHQASDAASLRAFLTGLLAGAGEIHDLGIIHRDIKPANVALRERDYGSPVLLDFGLAKLADMSSHTQLGQFRGTTAYAAPEQLRGEPARTRADLFSIAVVTYEAGTGTHPFLTEQTSTVQDLHDRILEGPPPDPRETARELWDEDVATVVLRLLSYAQHERLSSARALRALEGEA